jgi:hypothetical protein
MSDFVLSQALIGVVFFIDLASFQFRDRRRVLICLGTAALLIGVHFWLLEAWTAAIAGFIAAARFLTAIFTSSKRLLGFFLLAVLVNAAWSYAGLLTILATLGSLLSTTAAFLAADRAFRQMMMVSSLVWIVHNILAFTPAAVVLETFFLGSNVFAYYRFYIRRRPLPPGD